MAASVVRPGPPVNHLAPGRCGWCAARGPVGLAYVDDGRRPVRRIEIGGVAATVERLSAAATAGYGHFTAMQVREHRVRGLDLYLARLDAANRSCSPRVLTRPRYPRMNCRIRGS
jgi:hypothetical protein